MNLYQCQEKAKDVGFDKAQFYAAFPAGPVLCKWLDAYMGLLEIDVEGLREGVVMVKQIDEAFPELQCSDLFINDEGKGHASTHDSSS